MDLGEAYMNIDLSGSLISIFCDVAYALHYLHQRRQTIIAEREARQVIESRCRFMYGSR